MKAPKFQIIPSNITDPQEAERLRGMKAGQCFRHLLDAAKGQIDYAHGLGEAEAVLQAWAHGTRHPFFQIWQQRQGAQKRPGPTATELGSAADGAAHVRGARACRFQQSATQAPQICSWGAKGLYGFSGAAGGGCDLVLPMLGRDYRVEAKHHGASFKQIYVWLALVDLLIVCADRAAPLAVMPLDLLIDLICKAEGKERASYLFRDGGE